MNTQRCWENAALKTAGAPPLPTHLLTSSIWLLLNYMQGICRHKSGFPRKPGRSPWNRTGTSPTRCWRRPRRGELAAPRGSGCGHGRRPREAEIISVSAMCFWLNHAVSFKYRFLFSSLSVPTCLPPLSVLSPVLFCLLHPSFPWCQMSFTLSFLGTVPPAGREDRKSVV